MSEQTNPPLDLDAIRSRLAGRSGQAYWRSLEEVAQSPAFTRYLADEFPELCEPDASGGMSRRRFLQLMGASLALAGLTSCGERRPERIVPYVRQPEQVVPGLPLYFATAHTFAGLARGILVESHEGRPTKIEGNPEHPSSPPPAGVWQASQPREGEPRTAVEQTTPRFPYAPSDIFAQASLLTLYDPERSQAVRHLNRITSWTRFEQAIRGQIERLAERGGQGLRLLTQSFSSPTLTHQITRLLEQYPQARWHQYEPVNRDSARLGAIEAFGRDVWSHHRFDQAAVVLALDSDFLTSGSDAVRHANAFMRGRRVNREARLMNRLYAVESTPTNTGAVADHRLSLSPPALEQFAQAVAQQIENAGGATEPGREDGEGGGDGTQTISPAAVAADLLNHRGQCLVVVGDHASPRIHALAHAMNAALDNVGRTVEYLPSPIACPQELAEGRTTQVQSLADLAQDMEAGEVELLVMLGGNPVYDAPADVGFADALRGARQSVHISLYHDETSFQSHWHVPLAHELEAWGDGRAADGTITIMQPLIAPLYEGRTFHQVLAVMLGEPGESSHDLIHQYWRERLEQGDNDDPAEHAVGAENDQHQRDFEIFWRRTVHDGVMADTAYHRTSAPLQTSIRGLLRRGRRAGDVADAAAVTVQGDAPEPTVHLLFRPDPTVYDGRFANNGWLQECPKPLTKITWDNAVLISPRLAQRLGVSSEQMVELGVGDRAMTAAAWIMPGQPDDCITLHLGYGRTRAGSLGSGLGFNAYELRTSEAMASRAGVWLRPAAGQYTLARTQLHHSLDGRPIFRELTMAQFLEQAQAQQGDTDRHERDVPLSLYEPYEFVGTQWGMSIDLTTCIGCNACVIACQSENNIPIVGKEQVAVGREMHWIRVDTWYGGELDNPALSFQPVTCMHCESAPCETVCPVGATLHSDDGLNEMIYNRCIGTRYCSNNCPYKVRRFNFFQYVDRTATSLALMRNPNVTVRGRGVMEKCSYCVQRIRRAGIDARRSNEAIPTDEVVTACQSACPTHAIIFGDINDPASRVARAKAQPHDYGMLADLNTRPRTTYLARVRNPHEH